MLKKLFNGVVFGAGFGVAFLLVLGLGSKFLLPIILKYSPMGPAFQASNNGGLVQLDPSNSPRGTKEFSFFKDTYRMEIPENGGILSTTPLATPSGAERPSTYQLWLTQSELWQIETHGEEVEVKKLPHPDDASLDTLSSLMRTNLGLVVRQSSITVSDFQIKQLKLTGVAPRSEGLNGELNITVEGVVFILPGQFKT
ncbi:hypothetical protein BTA51_01130 [Hahella sp. CCB-MM4]|uniref:hypothetical protein n=1 Tax=Hahella sp. (strain CCB-MM4) TaxID=1926491 RepID=UPI000B9C3D01|nr:hypothetical protein [Hahella sp. CCB-MM4]OZG75035.1 hypothetical protein BTA51_01130 [Hahella sp. CCB-MM4]